MRERSRRSRFSLAALLLVAFGVVLLLDATGLAGARIWLELIELWPVLLILVGVAALLGRRPLICSGVAALILAATISLAFFDMPDRWASRDWDAPYLRQVGMGEAASYSTPIGMTETLQLNMEMGGGRVALASVARGDESPNNMLSAYFDDDRASVRHERSGSHTRIDFSMDTASFALCVGIWGSCEAVDWEVVVSSQVALGIDIDAGAADIDLDLRDLDVDRVDIGAGASDIRIQLPENAGRTQVVISAGASNIEIAVPRGVAARIVTESALSSTRIDSARFPRTGGVHQSARYDSARNSGYEFPARLPQRVHQSARYDSARNRVDVHIRGGAVDLTVG